MVVSIHQIISITKNKETVLSHLKWFSGRSSQSEDDSRKQLLFGISLTWGFVKAVTKFSEEK